MEHPKKILSTNNIDIGYPQNIVYYDISLDALQGELITLIGPNGVGKSTLLKTIAGLLPLINGEILIKGDDIKSIKGKKLAEAISFVLSGSSPYGNMLVYELIALGRVPYTNLIGRLKEEDKIIIENVIRETGINHIKHKHITEISDGERQKTMIARALAQDTDLIILDEPTAFLDIANKFEIINLLHTLVRENNKTIIFSSHDLRMSINSADKIWLMLPDKNIQEGAPEDLIIDGYFDKLFKSDKISFNKKTGFFEQTIPKKQPIMLSGDNPITVEWTKKALEKTGCEITNKANEKIIHTERNGKNEWIYSNPKDKKHFQSIYTLIKYLINIT